VTADGWTVCANRQRCTTDGWPHTTTPTVASASQRCTTDGWPHTTTPTVACASRGCVISGRPETMASLAPNRLALNALVGQQQNADLRQPPHVAPLAPFPAGATKSVISTAMHEFNLGASGHDVHVPDGAPPTGGAAPGLALDGRTHRADPLPLPRR
jgi:hypothetical protein